MNSRTAINMLKEAGFKIKREGRGSHLIMSNGSKTVIISEGQQELSSGMTKKVKSLARTKINVEPR